MVDYQTEDCLKEGTQIFILLLVQQKVDHEIFFHLLDLTVLNSCILLFSCGANYTDRDFKLLLLWKLTEKAEKSQDHPNPRLVIRPSVGPEIVLLLKGHNKQWQVKSSTQIRCCLCACHGPKRARCINAPDVMWACSRCLVSWNITPK